MDFFYEAMLLLISLVILIVTWQEAPENCICILSTMLMVTQNCIHINDSYYVAQSDLAKRKNQQQNSKTETAFIFIQIY